MRKASKKRRRQILVAAAILEPIVEIAHIIWLFLAGETKLFSLLPFHMCGIQMFFIPFAVFTRIQTVREFTFFSALLGGIFAILSPAGVVEKYPFFHFQTLQTFLLHALLAFVPLAMLLYDNFYPRLRNFPKVLLLAAGAVLPAVIVDIASGENYMFLCAPPQSTFLVPFFERYGANVYRTVLACGLVVLVFLLYLPFEFYKKALQKGNRAL